MKASELRDLGSAELQKKIEELNQELFNFRFQLHTGHLENSSRIPEIGRASCRERVLKDV